MFLRLAMFCIWAGKKSTRRAKTSFRDTWSAAAGRESRSLPGPVSPLMTAATRESAPLSVVSLQGDYVNYFYVNYSNIHTTVMLPMLQLFHEI